jgi:hypothetical protein
MRFPASFAPDAVIAVVADGSAGARADGLVWRGPGEVRSDRP